MQVQFFYDITEDRLKLIVADGDDARGWWITRRAARFVAEALAARLADTHPSDADAPDRDQFPAAQGTDAAGSIPIYSTPVLTVERVHLLTSIRHGRHTDGRHLLIFQGKNNEEQGLLYDDASLSAFGELFRKQLAQTDWDLPVDWADTEPAVPVLVDKLQ